MKYNNKSNSVVIVFTFYIFTIIRRYWFYVKHDFGVSSNLYVLRPSESEKTVLTKVSVCPVSLVSKNFMAVYCLIWPRFSHV